MVETAPHIPIMVEKVASQLITDPGGIYLDGTVGYGGHALFLLKKLTCKGKLIGLDIDPYALEYTQKLLSNAQGSYSLYRENYREYPNLLQTLGIKNLTGILLDLGSSSSQIDTGHRGFSFQSDAPLDMRFDSESGMNARDYLNSAKENEISHVIQEYGEERHHARIARNIFKAVRLGKMNTTFDLKHSIEIAVNPRFLNKSLARVFQAIRIKINDELNALKEALSYSAEWLIVGGRISVISFHSLEDRIIKHFFLEAEKTCICPRKYPVCICNTTPSYKVLTRKAIMPLKQEIQNNPRSRSAKLRVAERI